MGGIAAMCPCTKSWVITNIVFISPEPLNDILYEHRQNVQPSFVIPRHRSALYVILFTREAARIAMQKPSRNNSAGSQGPKADSKSRWRSKCDEKQIVVRGA